VPPSRGTPVAAHPIQRRTYDPRGGLPLTGGSLLLAKPGDPYDEPPKRLLGDREAARRHAVTKKIKAALHAPDEGLRWVLF
jgi:hypothetical protein